MGILSKSIKAVLPIRRSSPAGATLPTWQHGTPQQLDFSPERYAREGYMLNEMVYGCVEELASSAAEPRIVAYVRVNGKEEKRDDHPSLAVLSNPNPHMDSFCMWASVVMYYYIAGNAYLEIVLNRRGEPSELWSLRPERMRAVPDATSFLRGWEYWVDGHLYGELPHAEVIHFKTRHPLNDFYGLPPLAVAAKRTDLDNWMREFSISFFRNAGVPAGLLTIRQTLDDAERDLIREQYRTNYGGAAGWHNLMIIDGDEATYTPMGMPLGQSGLVMPELTDIGETRIAMVFGVPLILLQTRLGLQRSTYASYREARKSFWDETLSPLYISLGSALTRAFRPYYPDVTRWGFDLTTVQALQEDVDALHTRVRADYTTGLLGHREARVALGYRPEAESGDTFFVPSNLQRVPSDRIDELPEPPPAPPANHGANTARLDGDGVTGGRPNGRH